MGVAGSVSLVDVGLDLDDPPARPSADQDLVQELGADDTGVTVVEGRRQGLRRLIQGPDSGGSPNAARTAAGVTKLSWVPSRTDT